MLSPQNSNTERGEELARHCKSPQPEAGFPSEWVSHLQGPGVQDTQLKALKGSRRSCPPVGGGQRPLTPGS